jgi:hypothetical protein
MLKPYSGRRWRDIVIVGGAEYRQVFHAFVVQLIDIGSVYPNASINEAEGSINQQRQQFEGYLKRLTSFSHEPMLSGREKTLPQSGC